MANISLQRLSVQGFSFCGKFARRVSDWLRARPALAAWIFPSPEKSAAQHYREFNGRYFADFYEQERMLSDQPRMAFYQAAIARHIQPGDRVIDLGTGTGILAAFAARRGAAKVYAIDHSPILRHAKTLAAHNRIEHVEFIATHSSEFSLGERVDVIVHEQMGDCLFDEAMVANVTDLRDRLLRPGGLIVPSRFDFYCEPVQISDDRVTPFIWELNVHGYRYDCLERNRPQEPAYYHRSSSDRELVDHFLGEPDPILALDLQTLNESELPVEINFTRVAHRAGRCDALAVYFNARVDHDLCLTSSPLAAGRAPHWGYRLLRTEQTSFAAGEEMEIQLRVGAWSDPDTWRWTCNRRAATAGAQPPAPSLT